MNVGWQATFKFSELLQVFFDGKNRFDVTTGTMKEFISIAVSGPGMDKEMFLQDVPVESGTGVNVSEAVMEAIMAWAIAFRIIALTFDTCSVNTGKNQGSSKN